jgi:hypothetical protein
VHTGPTPTHRLREEIAHQLFDDDDTDSRRPHDERARARQRAPAPADAADDGRPRAERAPDSVFESEPATDVELFDDGS